MKKVMEFLFGKKYPIFNKEGDIEHSRKDSFKEWQERYKNDSNKNWRNHTGLYFKKENKND